MSNCIRIVAFLAWTQTPLALADESPSSSRPGTVRLRLELDVRQAPCVLHENPVVVVRIVNPNDFPVLIPSTSELFGMPSAVFTNPNGETVQLSSRNAHDGVGGRHIRIEPFRSCEREAFLFDDGIMCIDLPTVRGTYALRGQTNLGEVVVGTTHEHSANVNWEFPTQEFLVGERGVADGDAWKWLEPRLLELRSSMRFQEPPILDINVSKVRVLIEFLKRFPTSTYSPAIRWELGRLLPLAADSPYLPKAEGTTVESARAECLEYCLDRGGASTEGFLEWNPHVGGGNDSLEFAVMSNRWNLTNQIVTALDKKYPTDAEGIAFRGIISAAINDSMEGARQAAEAYKMRFADGEFRSQLEGTLRALERQLN